MPARPAPQGASRALMLQDGVMLHAGPESRLPHWPEGKSQNPARPRPPPDKIPPPASPVHHSDPQWPRLARLPAAPESSWVPSFPPCPCCPLGQGPSLGAVSGFLDQALAPGTGCFPPLGLIPAGTGPSSRGTAFFPHPLAPVPSAVSGPAARVVERPCRRREERRWSRLSGCKIRGVFTSLGPTVGLGKWWGAWKSLPSPPSSPAGLVRPTWLLTPPSISRSPGSGPPGTQADGHGDWLAALRVSGTPVQPLGSPLADCHNLTSIVPGMGMGSLDPATKAPGPVEACVCLSVRVRVGGEDCHRAGLGPPARRGPRAQARRSEQGQGLYACPGPTLSCFTN